MNKHIRLFPAAFIGAVAILLAVLASALPAGAQSRQPLPQDEAFRMTVRKGDDGLVLRWDIAPGYYLYQNQFAAKAADTGKDIPFSSPEGEIKDDPNFGRVAVFHDDVEAHIAPPSDVARVAVTYQGCQEAGICYPMMTRHLDVATLKIDAAATGFGAMMSQASEGGGFELADISSAQETGVSSSMNMDGAEPVEMPEAAAPPSDMVSRLLESGGGFWVVLSFLGFGILLSATPCVLPMYPILAGTLSREGDRLSAGRGFALASTYVVAMAAAFGLLGMAAAYSGQNLQVVLQSPIAIWIMAAVFTLLALSMFGLFELSLPAAWVNRISSMRGGRRGSFQSAAFLGFTSTLIIGPCVTAPLAGALIYISQSGDVVLGSLALFALGLGQGIPLVVLATLGAGALPRAGAWMQHVRHVFAFVFLGMALWLLERVLPGPALLASWAVLLIGAAVFIGGFDRLNPDSPVSTRLRKTAGIALVGVAALLGLGAALGGDDPLRPLALLQSDRGPATAAGAASVAEAAYPAFTTVSTQKELQAALDDARNQGRSTLLYATAEWCTTCKTIDARILPHAAVTPGLERVVRLKLDLTEMSADHQAVMQRYAIIGPPTMQMFDRSGKAATVLVGEEITPDTLGKALGQLGEAG